MKNLHRVLKQKNISTKEQLQKFLIGKTVRIASKQQPHNYGKVGSEFVVEKIENLCLDENPHAQLKDYCNKIYFKDLEIHNRKVKTDLVKKLLKEMGVSTLEQITTFQNIFR